MKTIVPECEISEGDTAESRTNKNFNDAQEKAKNKAPNECSDCMAAGSQGGGSGSDSNRNELKMDDTSHNQSLVFGSAEFNKNRTIIIRNVPVVTYDEVKSFMGKFTIANIAISKRLRHALVTLKHGEEAESCIALLSKTMLKDKQVEVSLYRNDNLLCITNLPLMMEDTDFRKFVEPFGQIEKGFLMRNTCGKSLGYGFVEFMHNREKSERARQQINLKFIDSNVVRCQFVKDTILSFNQLNSRCLIADGLPNTFANRNTARDFFAIFEDPYSCETGAVQDQFLGFAVAEFSTIVAAQRTFELLHGSGRVHSSVRVSFATPGETVAEVFSSMFTVKSRLLIPNPLLSNLFNDVGGDVMSGAQCNAPPTDLLSIVNPLVWSLLQQNPIVSENFVQLMRLLGQQQQQQILGQQRQQQSVDPAANMGYAGMIPNPAMSLGNPNLQISLLSVMLAAQLQQLQPALLTNPALLLQPSPSIQQASVNPLIAQANTMLQNLMVNQAPAANRIIQTVDPTWNSVLCQGGIEPSASIFGLPGVYSVPQTEPLASAIAAEPSQERPLFPLSKDLNTVLSNVQDQADRQPRPILGTHHRSDAVPLSLLPAAPKEPASPIVAQAIEATIRDRLQNLEKHPTKAIEDHSSSVEMLNAETVRRVVRPISTPKNYPKKHERQRQNLVHIRGKQPLRQRFLDNAVQPEESNSELPAALINQPVGLMHNRASSQPALFNWSVSQMSSILNPSQPDQLRKETKPTAIHGLDSGFEPNQLGWSTLTEFGQWQAPIRPVSQPSVIGTVAGTHMAKVRVGSTLFPDRGKSDHDQVLFQATPGQKRPHFVQSPEPSPEGPYVGQHSQGIGGHYAESYFKHKKL